MYRIPILEFGGLGPKNVTMQSKWTRTLARYDELVDQISEFERKGKTMPYTSANGHMFSLLNKEGDLGIRLSKEDGAQFMEAFNSGSFKSHGATMRGYVRIPDAVLADTKKMIALLKKGHSYVLTLAPK